MTAIGHNSGGVASDRLRSFVERVERIESDIADLNSDKSDVYQEAKAEGWDVPAMKALVAERRKRSKDPQRFTEQASILDLYRDALGDGTAIATRARTSEVA